MQPRWFPAVLSAGLILAIGCDLSTPPAKKPPGPRPADVTEQPARSSQGTDGAKNRDPQQPPVPTEAIDTIVLVSQAFETCLSLANRYHAVFQDASFEDSEEQAEIDLLRQSSESPLADAVTALQLAEGQWALATSNTSADVFQSVEVLRKEARTVCRSVQGSVSESEVQEALYREVNFRAAETALGRRVPISSEDRDDVLVRFELTSLGRAVIDPEEYRRKKQEWEEFVARKERQEEEKRQRLAKQQEERDRQKRAELEEARRRAEQSRKPAIDPALQNAMNDWHRKYSVAVLPLKKALQRYNQVRYAGPQQKERACRDLWQASSDLLQQQPLFKTPEPSIGPLLKASFSGFQQAAAECVKGQEANAEAQYQRGADRLSQAIQSMATFGLSP